MILVGGLVGMCTCINLKGAFGIPNIQSISEGLYPNFPNFTWVSWGQYPAFREAISQNWDFRNRSLFMTVGRRKMTIYEKNSQGSLGVQAKRSAAHSTLCDNFSTPRSTLRENN